MPTERSVYQTALDLLSRRDHFRRELEDKLRRRDLPDDEIAAAIARCEALGLIDDERVARRFVEVRAGSRGWGPRRLAAELQQRGLSREDAEGIAALPPDLAEDAVRTALRKLEIRAPAGWWRDGQRRARMVSSLITRGFEAEVAIAAVDALAESRENHNDALDDQ
jgi:regulatory protein